MMKRKYIKIALLLIAIVFDINVYAKSEVIPAKGKFESRFLIVVDTESFSAAKAEILDYKSVLESEGLGAVILVGEWSNPEILRSEIKELYSRKPVMEGAVFIGKIPIVRVQNFQHSTTAFKMDEEKFPIDESSVTSDRYYDDLDLEFEFMQQDAKNPLIFYYRIKESSPQIIMSDFYSARMMPPSDMGIEPGLLLKRYLKKVVAAHKESNPLDQLVIFNGHGYNSDCLTAWQNEQFAIKEQIPLAFKTSKGNGFYNFRQAPFMKYKLYEKLQQSGTDLFIFHEHGDFHIQYINGDYPAPNDLEITNPVFDKNKASDKIGPMSAMAASLRHSYRKYKGERAAKFKKELIEEYGFTEEFFNKSTLDSLRVQDSIFAADINIGLSDLRKIRMQPRLSIFDACYNGSFHRPGYIAGYHVFGEGNTIAAQGNTVNVLQDKWSLELLGLLAEGARIGFWQKEFQYLESHLIGDPTYQFAQLGSKEAKVLNTRLATKGGEMSAWKSYLKSNKVNEQTIAIKQLSKIPSKDFSAQLLKLFRESKHYSVRMEALKRLLDIRDANSIEAVRLGLDDPYELIRRFSARFAAYYGDNVFIAPLVNIVIFSNESQRVQYAAQSSLQMFDINEVVKEIENQGNASNLTDKQETIKNLSEYYKGQQRAQDKSLKTILDKSAKPENRLFAIRGLRNYNNHKQVTSLLPMLKDTSDDPDLRAALAEALGWFNLSIQKDVILDTLNDVYKESSISEKLKAEVLQSIKRM
ncbi:MAG: HEAT repeat domain-containing protein [Bacteroidales bacterium]|nr:HEAT repeat domain-containing protein [Bacteroidales bacterium]